MQTELIPELFKVNESVEVLVENVNDNPPNFAQNHFVLEVNEVSVVVPQMWWKVFTLLALLNLHIKGPACRNLKAEIKYNI